MTARAANEWGFYFPEAGETSADIIPIIGRIYDAGHAAHEACEYDYNSREGWERDETAFVVVVVSPQGEETRFSCWHERTIAHRAVPDAS